jgi:aryl-alcohol dehydrogenase-like predicted oxidoreductase
MRLSSEEPIRAALAAGVSVFDTARAYGESESIVARALHGVGARIVTKGGMRRAGSAWIPDGRAKAILADCEASLAALDGLPIDLYLIHAPDPRTPSATSVRALGRLLDDGLVRRVGLSNVNRGQLDEAIGLAPIAAVEVALSPYDDRARRGGVVDRCAEHGIAVIAHSPLGGPRRAGALGRNPALTAVAEAHGATPAEVALAWLLAIAPGVVAIPGARRPETARSAARAAALVLRADELATLTTAFGGARPPRPRRPQAGAEVALIMSPYRPAAETSSRVSRPDSGTTARRASPRPRSTRSGG